MSPFLGDLSEHAASAALDRLSAALRKARRTATELGQEPREQIQVFESVITYLKERLQATPSGLVPADTPEALATQLAAAANQMDEFVKSGNVGQLAPTSINLDSALKLLAQFPHIPPSEEAAAAVSAFDAARGSIRGYVGGLKAQINRLEKRTVTADTRATEIENEILAQKGRIDALITEQQAAFAQAQEQRTQANNAFLDQQRQRFDAEVKQLDELFQEHSSRLEARWGAYEEELKSFSDSAARLLEALGVSSQSAAFLASATREMWTARVWHSLAFTALLGLIYVAVFQILPSLGDAFDWAQFGGRAFIGATLLAAASYAGAQAAKHARREEYYRNMHLQLAALDPYLARLLDSQRDQIKASLAPSLFKVPAVADLEEQRANLMEDVMKVVLKALGSAGAK